MSKKTTIDYAQLYEFLGVKINTFNDTTAEAVGWCPFHQDATPSFAFNASNGLWKCFAGCGSGDVYALLCRRFKAVRSDAEDVLHALLDPIDDEWQHNHDNLVNNVKVLQWLQENRGLTKTTVERYKLGYDGQCYTIPISIDGVLVNVRKKKYVDGKRSRTLGIEGFNTKKLWPYENLFVSDTLHIMEGEMDCLLANQLGVNAVTVTAGAGNWRDEWGALFKDVGIKKVVLCYDIDKAGARGAEKIQQRLQDHVKVVVVKLPLVEPANADFTDFIHKQGHQLKEYYDCVNIAETEVVKPKPASEAVRTELPTLDTTLHASSGREYYYRRVKLSVIVSGKNLTPYLIPRTIEVSCPRMSGVSQAQIKKKCLYCKLASQAEQVLSIDETTTIALKLIDRNDMQIKGYLKEFAGIPSDCSSYKMKIIDTQNVEEVRVIPDISFIEMTEYSEYVSRMVYYLDMKNKRIKTNASYKVEGVVMPHPNSQASTILINKVTPAQTDIDTFEVTPEVVKALKVFQPSQGQTMSQKVNEVTEDLIYNVTKMYQRDDFVIGFNLIACSVLDFEFMSEYIDKGRVEGLFLGDKGCGKSKTIERLVRHFRAGEIVTGENLSYAGLVGGISSDGGSFMIQWGKLPLNDRRMVCFDEALKEETIEQMSATRSSGIAEITKIQSEKTTARVRLCWSANPRSGRNLNTYANGVLAVQELMGKVEDTRRLDFAITAVETDVDLSHIEDEVAKKIPHNYTSDRYAKLILWIWSRKKDDVVFSAAAVTTILKYSNEMSRRYTSSIPLVEPTEQRIKIARLSAAVAAWQFCTDDDGEKVYVKPEHVEFVFNFLKFCYDKPSMGYDAYSAQMFKRTRVTGVKREELMKEFKSKFLHWQEIRDALLENRIFRKGDLVDQTGMDKLETQEFFKWTARNKLVSSTSVGFAQSPVLMEIMKTMSSHSEDKQNEDGGI